MFRYNANGNITDVTDEEGVELEYYEYDALGQLTMAYKNGAVYEYAYDAGGNLLYQKKDNEVVKTYAYTDPVWKDRLTSFNGETITYDAIGNPTQYRGGLQLNWRYGRRLAGWYRNDEDFCEYGLNADGERIYKGSRYKYVEYTVVDGLTVGERCDDYTGANPFHYTMYYLFDENGDIYGITYNGANYFFRKNLQGDVIGIWNSAGTEIVTYTYDPWGKVLTVNDNSGINLGTINPFRYRTYYYDVETGLYYLNSRYYDPETGRFLNADSVIPGSTESVQGYNLFAYCHNNPVNMSDGNGRWPSWNEVGNVLKKAFDAVVHIVISNPLSTGIRELHYSRNALNKTYSESEMKNKGGKLLKKSEDKFHQNNQKNGERNRKYVVGDWFSSENVYYSDGTLNNTAEDEGTFNVYYGDNAFLNIVVHGICDVIPYMIWGNSREDSTTIIDRVVVIFE